MADHVTYAFVAFLKSIFELESSDLVCYEPYGDTWHESQIFPNSNTCIFFTFYTLPNQPAYSLMTVWCQDYNFFSSDLKIFGMCII